MRRPAPQPRRLATPIAWVVLLLAALARLLAGGPRVQAAPLKLPSLGVTVIGSGWTPVANPSM